MDVRDFDFELPPGLIAQEPAAERGGARLLLLDRRTGHRAHGTIRRLPDHLRAGDVLVLNNTRVFPARLLGRRVPSGGAVECLLIGSVDGGEQRPPDAAHPSPADPFEQYWEALVHPGQKLKPGAQVVFEGARTLHGEILERRFYGRRLVRLWTEDRQPIDDVVDAIGHVPLPPYVKRQDRPDDRDRYQTVFARDRGSVAAPTAGLHLTRDLLAACAGRGVEVAEITLHVGYGTFQPVRVDRVEDHRIEPERYVVDPAAAETIARAKAEGRRVIAVGTTTARTLEAVALANGGTVVAGRGLADVFIYPGFAFQVLSGLLTNFHLPQSSLLMLVAAFAGRDAVLAAYREAVTQGYRFYSYGDAMFIA